jgi:hypothetical protein
LAFSIGPFPGPLNDSDGASVFARNLKPRMTIKDATVFGHVERMEEAAFLNIFFQAGERQRRADLNP